MAGAPECRYFNNFLTVSRETVPLKPAFLLLFSGSSARSWADTVRGRESATSSGAASSCQPPHLRSAEDLRAAGGSSRQSGAAAAGGHPDQQEEEGWCTVRRARSRYDIFVVKALDPDNGNVKMVSALRRTLWNWDHYLGL
jgi:hypothetical protein